MVRVAWASPVTQSRKIDSDSVRPLRRWRNRKSNFSAAPDLMMLVSSGWPAIEGWTAGQAGSGVFQKGGGKLGNLRRFALRVEEPSTGGKSRQTWRPRQGRVSRLFHLPGANS
jgi:hypothetical protein